MPGSGMILSFQRVEVSCELILMFLVRIRFWDGMNGEGAFEKNFIRFSNWGCTRKPPVKLNGLFKSIGDILVNFGQSLEGQVLGKGKISHIASICLLSQAIRYVLTILYKWCLEKHRFYKKKNAEFIKQNDSMNYYIK